MSKTICLDKQWIEIQNCSKCDFCDFEGGIYRCCIFDRKSNKYHSSTSAKELLDTCRLPDYDVMREHGPDEIPNNNKDVLLSVKHKDGNEIEVVQAYYDFDRWNYSHNDDTLPPFYEIISWREIL